MTIGSLIISLDCEAKWGLADVLDEGSSVVLTEANLTRAYDRICRLFNAYDVPATFAFVAMLLLDDEKAASEMDAMPSSIKHAMAGWLSAYWIEKKAGKTQGWHLPHLLEIVAARGSHEVASHGFCHFPLQAREATDEAARFELAASSRILKELGESPQTYIFARNEIRCPSEVGRVGYVGYRGARADRTPFARARNLLEEFAPLTKAENPSSFALDCGGAHRIPAGRFFNFGIGLRKVVPAFCTVTRWKSIIQDASEHGRVAHLWFHPHNAIADPDGLRALEEVLEYACKLRCRGQLQILTQHQYVMQVESQAA